MSKISVINHGTVHHQAHCAGCDWSDAIEIEEVNRSQKLRNRMYKHIRKTGHGVHVEAGTSRDYFLENKE
ncbi:hypothetical protein LCGC14_2364830 [marine sediment metagenome]|uniref:Uncharacterized protein n=1 Tax=marine sediment metagenome TaxID=412755 RepID=A0A0F9C5E6_9ZZZZ